MYGDVLSVKDISTPYKTRVVTGNNIIIHHIETLSYETQFWYNHLVR